MVQLTKLTIIKILELIIVCCLVILHYYSFNAGDEHTAMITMGTFGGYLIIFGGVLMGNVMGEPVERRVDLYFSLVGVVSFIIVGALNIDFFANLAFRGSFRNRGLAKGVISLVEAVLLILDAFFTYRGED